jgi:hypothetical protein
VSGEPRLLVVGLFTSLRVDKATLKQFYLQVLRLSPVIYNSTNTTYSYVVHPGMEAPVPHHQKMKKESCTREIKSRIAMAKAAFSKKKNLFISKKDLNLRKKLVKCYI